jgi:hypothetical protein
VKNIIPLRQGRALRLAEDGAQLIAEATARISAIEQALDLAMIDGAIDLGLGAALLDLAGRARTHLAQVAVPW